jgi:hypothetical protein
LTNSFAN